MKQILFLGLVTVFMLVNISCDKKDCIHPSENGDFIVFGHFYGKCFGEGCVETYKIIDSKLYEDTLDQYPGSDTFYPGQFVNQLSAEKYNLVKDLETYFPQELLNETATVIGQPDAGDWGGIYFEIKSGSIHRFWLLDQMENNMPAVYNEFVDRINEKIALIHQ
jgi:hypothetical protein